MTSVDWQTERTNIMRVLGQEVGQKIRNDLPDQIMEQIHRQVASSVILQCREEINEKAAVFDRRNMRAIVIAALHAA